MKVRFNIILEDDSLIQSHEGDNWDTQVKDHAHALAPHNTKRWKIYQLLTDDGKSIEVNFQNGSIALNGQIIHLADKDGNAYTGEHEAQTFPVSEEWTILNGSNYFPIAGRHVFKGEWGEALVYYVGWKKKIGKNTIQKIIKLLPNGQILLT